jgi:hypothetical protein
MPSHVGHTQISKWATPHCQRPTPSGRLLLHVQDHVYRSPDIVHFLRHLLRHVPGKPLVMWDGAPIHRGRPIREFLARGGAKRLRLEQLPGSSCRRRRAVRCRHFQLDLRTTADNWLTHRGPGRCDLENDLQLNRSAARWTHQVDAKVPPTGHQEICITRAGIHQVLVRQQPPFGKTLMDKRQAIPISNRCEHRVHLRNQVRGLRLARLREMGRLDGPRW